MKRFIFSLLAPLAVFILCCCDSDDLSGDSYYTFKGETVATYIENRPDSFSVFTQVVKDAGEESLLATSYLQTRHLMHTSRNIIPRWNN